MLEARLLVFVSATASLLPSSQLQFSYLSGGQKSRIIVTNFEFKLKFTRVTLPEPKKCATNAWSAPCLLAFLNLLAFRVENTRHMARTTDPTPRIPLILNVMPPQKSQKPAERPQANGNRYGEVLRLAICSNPTQSRKGNTHIERGNSSGNYSITRRVPCAAILQSVLGYPDYDSPRTLGETLQVADDVR